MTKITKKKFREAIKGSAGTLNVIASKLYCTRHAVYLYLKKHPELRKEINDEWEAFKDNAGHKLNEKVVNGDWKALKFFLMTQCKDRGYYTKQEVEGKQDFGSVNITIVKSGKKVKGGDDETSQTK